MRYLILLTISALTLGACAAQLQHHQYPSRPDTSTPGGVAVTRHHQDVDLAAIDRVVADFLACAGAESLPRWELVIAPPADSSPYPDHGWYVSEGGVQLIHDVDWAGQTNGLTQWQPGYQDPVVVVTPDMRALAHELVHVLTQSPSHSDPLYDECT